MARTGGPSQGSVSSGLAANTDARVIGVGSFVEKYAERLAVSDGRGALERVGAVRAFDEDFRAFLEDQAIDVRVSAKGGHLERDVVVLGSGLDARR